jgi:hypothetical protein
LGQPTDYDMMLENYVREAQRDKRKWKKKNYHMRQILIDQLFRDLL